MPPHCDSMDGPVVQAATRALAAGDVKLVLPYVHKEGEEGLEQAFEKVLLARRDGGAAREVADLFFFETAVRVHRAGEGAPFTGLKPAGLDVGPVIPVAEEAVESGSPERLITILSDAVREAVRQKFDHLMELKPQAAGSVDEARRYVEAMLGLEVYSHKLYQCIQAGPEAAHKHHE